MKRKALFIGVNEYKDPEIRNLNCSCRDAISMHDIFELLGYQTRLLEDPSKVDVFNAIREMTIGNSPEDALRPGDQFLMYFAGHGFTDSGQHLLFCADDMYKQLRYHRAGIPFDQLEEETRSGGYDRVFLLDACQSDFLTGTRGEDTTTRDLVAIGDMVPSFEDATGSFYVLRSCSKFEHALEIESRKHGLFTLGMLELLRQSKKDNAELAFNDSLREAVRKKMWCIAESAGITVRQTPESDGRGAVQVLICGMKTEPSSVPVMVDCPVCGRHNRVDETFKCKICGRDHLCASHFSDEGNCCKECAEKLEVQTNTKSAIEAYNSNDYAKAFSLAQKSDQNSAVIQYILGYCFSNGCGCEKNEAEAIKWYRKAAKQGHDEARICLENIWTEGAVKLANEHKKLDEEKFWDEIKRVDDAQVKGGSGQFHSRLFRDELYDDIMRIDWTKALYMISEAEKQVVGEIEKERQIAKAIVNNDKEVCSLSTIEVENPYIQFQIGMAYYAHPVAMNKDLAAKWFEKSAMQKCAPSLYMLGRMYEYGESVKQSYVKAKKLFDRVGIDEIPMSDVAIAHMYEFGLADAEEKDIGAAMEWYEYAVGHGCNAVMPLYLRSARTFYSLHPDRTPEFNIQRAAKGSYESFSQILFSLQECIKSADQGNVEDQNKLGWLYLTGDGVPQDDGEAMKWYRRAADHGDANALYNIGWAYGNGRGVAKDDVEAVKWYRKAAELEYALAQNNLGWMYANGEEVKQDDREALAWFRKAAEQGNDNAQYSVGWMYENGRGVDRNDVEAVKWYVKAAEQGHEEALSNITSMAEQGCVDAQYNLALLYLNGKGVEKNSAEALKWFLKAAEQKNVDAQLWAGVMYGNGNGVPKNFEEAAKWYRAAADQGNAMAQFNLGVMYANGLGVKGDLSVAAEWYRRAAAQGHEKAKEALKKIESVLKNDAIFKGVMRDFLKKTNGGVKKAASGEGAKPSDLKTGTVKTLVLPGGAKMEMIYVAPGSFMMGSPEGEAGRYRNETLHHVTITKGYWLGKYPVTQEQWVSVMKNNQSRFKGDSRPVENVSWNDCKMFIGKVRLESEYVVRLPTEAEWEYACRAGSTGGYGVRGSIDQISWHCDNSNETTHPVGQKGENAWGVNDMHGNVWEWCEDWYGAYINKAQVDPIGADSGESRVARGGSWFDPVYCGRSAMRSSYSPSVRDPAMGFRLCCSM